MIHKLTDLLYFSVAWILSKILCLFPAYRDIWIITERRNECKDNGYYLFRYIREHYPDKKVYYAINKKSDHVAKISDLGHVIWFNSLRHYTYALLASKLIGAFLPVGIPDSVCFYKFPALIKGKKVFLQHGITKEDIPSLTYQQAKVDRFICAARPEYDFIVQSFGYPSENVKLTGFCRFDGLSCPDVQKEILIMPTWRQWIPSATWQKKSGTNPDDYEYFKCYQSLLHSKELLRVTKDNQYRIVFFLHHEMQPYIDYFSGLDDSILLASEKTHDVQQLLKSCRLLITDYSSVQFDVAYMGKPVIYYQFDEERYYRDHYPKGYFDYDTMAFGPKCLTEDAVVSKVHDAFQNDFRVDPLYAERCAAFFFSHDTENSARVFHEITEC